MKIIIRYLTGPQTGRSLKFPWQRILIGRDEECDVRFDLQRDREVSGRHAEIIPGEGRQVEIRDLDSTNGILVNGEKTSHTTLHPGDEIDLGDGGPRLRFGLRRPGMAGWIDVVFRRQERRTR